MKFLVKESIARRGSDKLSVKDKKLIQLLIQDARMPVTQLAKKVGISQSAVVQKIAQLKKKGVLINPVLYSNIKSYDSPLYIYEISTQIGIDDKKITENLIKIPGIVSVLWYNGPYNLVLAFHTKDPQNILDKIQEFVEIKKLRMRKAVDNWFHPPHLFKEIPDKKTGFKRIIPRVERIDKNILNVLEENPIASFTEISAKTKLAVQTIKKHLTYLEKSGIIISYHFFPEVWLCGREIISANLSIKGKKETERLVKHLLTIPEVGNIWEYDHEWNLGFVLWINEQFEVNKIINNITKNFKILDYDVSILAGMIGK